MSFTPANIIGNLLFSGIGYVVFMYGKRMSKGLAMIQGVALMGYSYVVPNTFWMYAIGAGLTAWAYLSREG